MYKNPTKKHVVKRCLIETERVENIVQDIGELKGMLADANAKGETSVIVDVPMYLLAYDPAYQTPERTGRNLSYLENNWDEARLLPVTGVPHYETGKIFITDGVGRATIAHKKGYKTIRCMVLLNVSQDKIERQKYEAYIYAFQNGQVAKIQPFQKHGAMMILGDEATLALDKAVRAYNFSYPTVCSKGKRKIGVIGSYDRCLTVARAGGFDAIDYVFNVIKSSGFDRQTGGLSQHIILSIWDIYKLYPEDRRVSRRCLGKLLRETSPVHVTANALTKYSHHDKKVALSLYLEDMFLRAKSSIKRKRYEDATTKKVVYVA